MKRVEKPVIAGRKRVEVRYVFLSLAHFDCVLHSISIF